MALAGVQKYWKVCTKGSEATLSGFGGRKEPTDRDWVDTAWREVVEELFHVKTVPLPLLEELRTTIQVGSVGVTGGYVMLRYSFRELATALELMRRHLRTSVLYKVFPVSLSELVTGRELCAEAEIGSLALIPMTRFRVGVEFQKDLSTGHTT